MKNQTTTEAKILQDFRNKFDLDYLYKIHGDYFTVNMKEVEEHFMQLLAQEKKDLLEEVKANLPEVDKAEAVKHRPDNSVGFMLGWNAYEEKLQKLLKILAHSQEDREMITEQSIKDDLFADIMRFQTKELTVYELMDKILSCKKLEQWFIQLAHSQEDREGKEVEDNDTRNDG